MTTVQKEIQWWFERVKRLRFRTASKEQAKELHFAEHELARWCQKAIRGETQ